VGGGGGHPQAPSEVLDREESPGAVAEVVPGKLGGAGEPLERLGAELGRAIESILLFIKVVRLRLLVSRDKVFH